jgi:hypothetical protein
MLHHLSEMFEAFVLIASDTTVLCVKKAFCSPDTRTPCVWVRRYFTLQLMVCLGSFDVV